MLRVRAPSLPPFFLFQFPTSRPDGFRGLPDAVSHPQEREKASGLRWISPAFPLPLTRAGKQILNTCILQNRFYIISEGEKHANGHFYHIRNAGATLLERDQSDPCSCPVLFSDARIPFGSLRGSRKAVSVRSSVFHPPGREGKRVLTFRIEAPLPKYGGNAAVH